MKIAIGSDPAGFDLRHVLQDYLRDKGYEVIDYGCPEKVSVDYPIYGRAVAEAIKNGDTAYQNYGGQTGYGGYQSYGGFGGYQSYTGYGAQQQVRPEYQAAMNFITSRHYSEALNALSGVPETERDGTWYFLSAVANDALGNRVTALEHARTAVRMEPGNMQFRRLAQELENGGAAYSSYAGTYPSSGFTGSWCLDTILCNLCCNPCFSPCC